MRNIKNKVRKLPFDKYELYHEAVQSPETDVRFYQKVYKKIRNKKATQLREDFCGAGAISCEWVKLSDNNTAIGVDLDTEPTAYGYENYISKLNNDQKGRIQLINQNVLNPNLPKADILVAVNFSYFLFKQRELLKSYYANVYRELNKNGVFIMDAFGGTQCTHAIEDRTRQKGFEYFWNQKGFDPITNEAQFEINFKYKKRKYLGVFEYDWRMWSLPEIKDILKEVGFKDSLIYWEGTDKKGRGNGVFTERKKGEACESWIAYIVGVK